MNTLTLVGPPETNPEDPTQVVGPVLTSEPFDGTAESQRRLTELLRDEPRYLEPFTTLVFKRDTEPDDAAKSILVNFMAVICKAWRFIDVTRAGGPGGPLNPWTHASSYADGEGRFTIRPLDHSVTIILNNSSAPIPAAQFQAVAWRMLNAFDWACLPQRRRLKGAARFSRETWDAISVNIDPRVLKMEESPIPADPQAGSEALPTIEGAFDDGPPDDAL